MIWIYLFLPKQNCNDESQFIKILKFIVNVRLQPKRLVSPTTVIDRKRQKGNCFEYSTVLVSLLIAAGYDAYVVSGYATRETCLMDETREICPMLTARKEVGVEFDLVPIGLSIE